MNFIYQLYHIFDCYQIFLIEFSQLIQSECLDYLPFVVNFELLGSEIFVNPSNSCVKQCKLKINEILISN